MLVTLVKTQQDCLIRL